ncbi:MAG: sigma-70 family RNA polymerase sigma factor [Candidatus Azambacteria bacterium]|nr:sigma-70 family RNA polymerase sigma factor [Candidatus Azambacteria bacterium]
MKSISDEQLVKDYLNGNEKALEELIQRYLPLIYGFSRRYSGDADNASDIAQEIFVKVWRNIRKFNTSKNFKAWILIVAKNTALDWLKKKNAVPFSLLKECYEDENFEANIIDVDQTAMIDRFYIESFSKNAVLLIEKLPKKYNSVINLYHNKDLNFREIAATLNESINTVKSRYRRGLILLRKSLL